MHRVHRIRHHGAVLHVRLWRLVTSPLFIWITVIFHSIVVGAAMLMRSIESAANPDLSDIFTAIYWAVSTVTTVGYGDVVPMTHLGKFLAVCLMITGPVFTAVYTALFASALLAPELEEVERDVRGVRTQFKELEKEVRDDEQHIEKLLVDLQTALTSMRRKARNEEGK